MPTPILWFPIMQNFQARSYLPRAHPKDWLPVPILAAVISTPFTKFQIMRRIYSIRTVLMFSEICRTGWNLLWRWRLRQTRFLPMKYLFAVAMESHYIIIVRSVSLSMSSHASSVLHIIDKNDWPPSNQSLQITKHVLKPAFYAPRILLYVESLHWAIKLYFRYFFSFMSRVGKKKC